MPWESDVVDEDTADFEDLKLAHGSEMVFLHAATSVRIRIKRHRAL